MFEIPRWEVLLHLNVFLYNAIIKPARLILDAKFSDNSVKLFTKLGWLPIEDIIRSKKVKWTEISKCHFNQPNAKNIYYWVKLRKMFAFRALKRELQKKMRGFPKASQKRFWITAHWNGRNGRSFWRHNWCFWRWPQTNFADRTDGNVNYNVWWKINLYFTWESRNFPDVFCLFIALSTSSRWIFKESVNSQMEKPKVCRRGWRCQNTQNLVISRCSLAENRLWKVNKIQKGRA